MSNHFSMGAINKTTNKYEYPKIANKINKYKCPFCEKNVIFRNGKIKQPHFAHYKSDNPCSYYEKQMSESDNEDQDTELKMIKNFNSKHRRLTAIYDYSYDIADDDTISLATTEDSINL